MKTDTLILEKLTIIESRLGTLIDHIERQEESEGERRAMIQDLMGLFAPIISGWMMSRQQPAAGDKEVT